MSQTVSLDNFTGNILSQVKLTSDIAAGITALPVQNTAEFISGVPILLGNPGAPVCEILTTTTPASTTIATVTVATDLPHNSSEQVSVLFGTSLKIYRASDQYGTGQQPDDDNFSLLATIVIDPTQSDTVYTDSSSGVYWYKYTFLNTTTTDETAIADSIAMEAGQIHYVSIQQIRDAAGFSDAPQLTDSKISTFRDAAEKEINGSLAAIYNLPFPQPTNPILVQITKNIAAGELMQDQYNTIAPSIAAQGATKASQARKGGGDYTSLQDLVGRTVILQDADYIDLSADDAVGFNGYPDNTANTFSASPGEVNELRNFTINEVY